MPGTIIKPKKIIEPQYRVVITHSVTQLNEIVGELIKTGWKPVGSHQVVEKHTQNRFRGTQHVDTLHEHEYTQTMVIE